MLLKELRVMRGPNMWSAEYHKIIAVKFDLAATSDISSERQKSFIEYFDSVYHIKPTYEEFGKCVCSYVLQLSSLLQGDSLFNTLAYPTRGILFGIIQYHVEQAGTAAIELAVTMVEAIINDAIPLDIITGTAQIATVSRRYSEGPTTSMIIDAALIRKIPVTAGPAGYTILGYGKYQKKISAAMSQYTSAIAVNIAGNKDHTKKFLESANIPVPKGIIARDEDDLMAVAVRLGYPLVTKPFNGNQGRNVTCNIANFEHLLTGFRYAKEASGSVIIEKEITGCDYRLLVIGNKFHAASLRLAAFVTGNGILTIAELVEIENSNPKRGSGHENILTKITLDAAAELCLQKQGLSTASIPLCEQQVFLKSTANLSTGGTAEDVTDIVHPKNVLLAEKVARVMGLDICGIDIMSSDIATPLLENDGAVIEVNAAPGLRMHKYPSKGSPREVGDPIVELMFKNNENGRIPIVAITGTNGKTTTTRLMAHVATSLGNTVGFSSTDGIYIGGEKVQAGDCSGPQSARTILHDTTVDFAVLECARGGIIRSGLGFDQCDIAIVTNVAADHLGLKDVYTVDDLAMVKLVVPASVKKEGWAILNAGDEHCCAMRHKIKANTAFFCLNEKNEFLQTHIHNGGCAIYLDDRQDIYITKEGKKIFIFNAAEIPITRNGLAGFMIENLLPVVLASYLLGMSQEAFSLALKNFIPSPEETPGRINEFVINGVNVIVDYAHNPHGLRALSRYLNNIPATKLGIITGTGDRREEDIIEFGRIAAATYDDIIIRFDRDLRGRTQEDIVALLTIGIHEVKPQMEFQIIPDTKTAIQFAVETVEKGSYVIVCADNAAHTVELTNQVAANFQHSSD